MNSIFSTMNLKLEEKRAKAWQATQNKDYKGYKFGFCNDLYMAFNDIGVCKEDVQVIAMLMTVAQMIEIETVNKWIEQAISHNELKDWLINDILFDCDNTFYDDITIGQIIKRIYPIDEDKLVTVFSLMNQQLKY